MNLNRSVLVALAMVVGSFSAMGCKTSTDASAAPVAQEQSPAVAAKTDAPVVNDAITQVATSPGVEQDSRGFRYARPAPPAMRVEYEGRAPSAHHVWQRGYWRWDSPRTVYVWAPGFWLDQELYAPQAPPAPRYEDPGYAPSAEYFYVPGSWRWTGREYTWCSGRWEGRREGYDYVQTRWEQRDGRWQNRAGYWNARPRADRDDHRADRNDQRDDRGTRDARGDHRADDHRADDHRAADHRADDHRGEARDVRRPDAEHDHHAALPQPQHVDHDHGAGQRDPGFHRVVPSNTPVRRGHG